MKRTIHFFLCQNNTEQICLRENLFASTENRIINTSENDFCLLYNFSNKKVVYGIWTATNDKAKDTHSEFWIGKYPNRIRVKPLFQNKPISVPKIEVQNILKTDIKDLNRIFPPEILVDDNQVKQLFELFKVDTNYISNKTEIKNIEKIALNNQGNITEKVFKRYNKEVLTYNEMKFGSLSELEIAKELEEREILFFPLPFAVRGKGIDHKNHREPDFLVCLKGTWGILEVAHHIPERYEKDQEKSAWFKKSGILCVEHYTAEKCLNKPKEVVDEFLDILSRYRR